jgi:hypothetical protein
MDTSHLDKRPESSIHLKKMCRVSARRLSIYNFAWRLPKASNLQAEFKILKKIIGTPNLLIKTKKVLKKSMFSTSNVYRSQKFVWGLPNGICRLDSKSLKKISEHQINQLN